MRKEGWKRTDKNIGDILVLNSGWCIYRVNHRFMKYAFCFLCRSGRSLSVNRPFWRNQRRRRSWENRGSTARRLVHSRFAFPTRFLSCSAPCHSSTFLPPYSSSSITLTLCRSRCKWRSFRRDRRIRRRWWRLWRNIRRVGLNISTTFEPRRLQCDRTCCSWNLHSLFFFPFGLVGMSDKLDFLEGDQKTPKGAANAKGSTQTPKNAVNKKG